jgi:hypothetical protein
MPAASTTTKVLPEPEAPAAEQDVPVRLRMVTARLSRRLERTKAGAARTGGPV